jgi:formyl-CoA transferase
MSEPATLKPLDGLRVIECGVLLAGPFCGQLLADFGAEVIKIEQPGTGDPLREWGQQRPQGQSLWFPIVARGKKSVTLNLRVAEGQAILKSLVAGADVLLENFRPGTFEKWGLGYPALSAINPGLVMTRVSGYGQDGPYAGRAGYAAVGEAMAGMRYLMGYPDRPPSRAGISIGDTLAATHAALGTMMALEARRRTGRGQVVDATIYESCMAMMESVFTECAATGFVRERSGSSLPKIAPSNIYPAAGGAMILIAANQDTVFRRLAAAMDQPGLADDPRFASHTARGEREDELDGLIGAWTSRIEADSLLELLEESGVPCGRINSAQDVLDDPHVKARASLVEVPHPVLGSLTMQNVFPRLSETPGRVEHIGPDLGADTAEVLERLAGIGAADLERLRAAGVI